MKKVWFSLLVVSMLMLGSTMTASAQTTTTVSQDVGIVDVKLVVKESPRFRAIQEQLNVKGKELSGQLESAKVNFSPEEFQARQQAANDEFVKIKLELENEFGELLNKALGEVIKEKNLKVILYKDTVAYGGIDVSRDVINKLQ